MPFDFKRMEIPDVVLIVPKVFGDERGFFSELYKQSEFKQFGIDNKIVQVNHSKSKKNVLRGLHYQLNPRAQGKLVGVIAGEIFDVGVDIREGSPTFGKWVGEYLSSGNKKMLYIPEGFAHGFCVMSEYTEFIYFCTAEYSSNLDRGVLWNDPSININWPVENPLLSAKDENQPDLENAEINFTYNGD
jgi:dTDP-4-dehydrorhamnose 3,5-epimerase